MWTLSSQSLDLCASAYGERPWVSRSTFLVRILHRNVDSTFSSIHVRYDLPGIPLNYRAQTRQFPFTPHDSFSCCLPLLLGFSSGVRHERKHKSAGYAMRSAAGAGSAHLGFGRLRHAQDKRRRPEIGEAGGKNLCGSGQLAFRFRVFCLCFVYYSIFASTRGLLQEALCIFAQNSVELYFVSRFFCQLLIVAHVWSRLCFLLLLLYSSSKARQ